MCLEQDKPFLAERFITALKIATCEISDNYILLPVSYNHDPIYRERVYSYELYHQLRNHMNLGTSHVLNGEVDKRYHADFIHEDVRNRIPDLLVHTPGDMAGNLIAVEIKSIDGVVNGARGDLLKLNGFIRETGYFQGIYLIYGDVGEEGARRLKQVENLVNTFSEGRLIRIFWHSHAGTPAREQIVEWGE